MTLSCSPSWDCHILAGSCWDCRQSTKEGKVGKGKMRWEELNDEEAKRKARGETGLGASQTAEVAYLETWTYSSMLQDGVSVVKLDI